MANRPKPLVLVSNRIMVETTPFEIHHVLISITDPKSSYPLVKASPGRFDILYVQFYDLGEPHPKLKPIFNEEIAGRIWSFVNEYKDKVEAIICHCEAGLSRSPAVAAAIAKVLHGDDSEYFKTFLPNSLVYSTMLNVARGERRGNV